LSLKIEIHLYVLQEDLDGKTPSFEKLHKDLNIHLIIHDLSFLSALTTDEKDLFFKANFTCVVSSESDIEAISDFMVQHGAENYDLVPLFTGIICFFSNSLCIQHWRILKILTCPNGKFLPIWP
jgi:hypothetical protein